MLVYVVFFFFSNRRRQSRCALVTGVQTCALPISGGTLNKRGKPIDKGFLYKLFRNRLYLGEAVHKGTSYPGEHQAIIDEPLWDQVHAILQESPRQRAANTRPQTTALLKGLIFKDRGIAMPPPGTKQGSRQYRHSTPMDAHRNRG